LREYWKKGQVGRAMQGRGLCALGASSGDVRGGLIALPMPYQNLKMVRLLTYLVGISDLEKGAVSAVALCQDGRDCKWLRGWTRRGPLAIAGRLRLDGMLG